MNLLKIFAETGQSNLVLVLVLVLESKAPIVERAATRFNICCMLEIMFDRHQNILPTKNGEQMSSNMHAARSNNVDPTNVL